VAIRRRHRRGSPARVGSRLGTPSLLLVLALVLLVGTPAWGVGDGRAVPLEAHSLRSSPTVGPQSSDRDPSRRAAVIPRSEANADASRTAGRIAVVAGSGPTGHRPGPPPGPYVLQFNQTGVPAYSSWWINVTGFAPQHQTGHDVLGGVSVPNGTFPWSVAVEIAGGVGNPSHGNVTVAGQTVYVDVAFSVPNNTVTFRETGLDGLSGEAWSVAISGAALLNNGSISGTASSLSARLPDGPYTFRAMPPDMFWIVSPLTGNFSVGASPSIISLAFAVYVYVVFFDPHFSGTSPVAWSVLVSGAFTNSTGYTVYNGELFVNGSSQDVSQTFANSTYNYSVRVPAGDSVSPASGFLSVMGRGYGINFTISASPATGPVAWGIDGYLVLVTLAVVGLAAVLVVIRRRRGSPPAP
jgi:hypothetical protein